MNPDQQATMQTGSANYRWALFAERALAVLAAGLLGWAAALLLGLWGDHLAARLTPWQPFAPAIPALDEAPGVGSSPAPAFSAVKLVGVAGDRAYFVAASGGAQRVLALREGDQTPTGDVVRRIERDGVVLASGSGESRWPVLPVPAAPGRKVTATADASPAGVTAAANCRLSASDKAAAVFLDPAVVKALSAERATFARIFEPSAAGLRARGTGGTTAMFAIADGDLLTKVDGAPLRNSDSVLSEILGRLASGASVVVDGERNGAPRRWVFAPKGCG